VKAKEFLNQKLTKLLPKCTSIPPPPSFLPFQLCLLPFCLLRLGLLCVSLSFWPVSPAASFPASLCHWLITLFFSYLSTFLFSSGSFLLSSKDNNQTKKPPAISSTTP